MTATVGAFEAREQVTITKHARPVARLVHTTDSIMNRDWSAFWSRVDSRRVAMNPDTTIQADIEAVQAITP
jgi:antitoxin (DNA-binding transcriptional repressor) of toxin-antitoxin stability system